MPDFIEMTIDGATLTLASNRLLTTADIGTYEVAIQIDSGSTANNLSYLVFLLEVLHPSPTVVLNEYNAVEPDRYLNGGTAAADGDGAPASTDSHFGRIVGNGGNWFELAVVGDDTPGTINLDQLDYRSWKNCSFGKVCCFHYGCSERCRHLVFNFPRHLTHIHRTEQHGRWT
jgi:hypothetical protein